MKIRVLELYAESCYLEREQLLGGDGRSVRTRHPNQLLTSLSIELPSLSETIKLPETPKAQGTAGGAKAALQQHVKRHVDGKNPRDKNSSILKSLKGASFLRSRHTSPVKAGMGNRQPRHLDETLRVSDAAVHRLNGSWWAQYATFGRSRIVEYGT
ncbi:hypothetical protein C2G38_2165852 [Gigaspora rosea]|uniref:Uncharacterized protein n=1 Tax=Gigaspora rosea TaxID=44941 RepID=A0A397W2C6_9GLOM|nr:hypothetical protein C2G38_2165852 [Gigaspora rosea]